MDNIGKENNNYRIIFSGLRKAIRDPNLSIASKSIFIDIILYAGINNKSFPSQNTIAKDFNKSVRYISTLKNELKEKGYLMWERGRKGKSNRYVINQEIYTDASNIRSQSSISNRNIIPPTIRTPVQPKVIIESNQEISQLQLLFEKISKIKMSDFEVKNLKQLVINNSYDLVKNAINEASKRNLPYLKLGLIRNILNDWKNTGQPEPKPIFQPCNLNGCESGFIHLKNGNEKKCICFIEYRDKMSIWEKKWGNS